MVMPDDTIEIRILVGTWPDGRWSAFAWSGWDETSLRNEMAQCNDECEMALFSWVTARVPRPKPVGEAEVKGEVGDA